MLLPDFKIDGIWVKEYGKQSTKAYSVWRGLKKRCLVASEKRRHPTYIDCKISAEFLDFQNFTNWYTLQVGYGLDYAIDKDVILEGNKIYGPEFCALVPQQLNNFLIDHAKGRGLFAQGVCYNKRCGKYSSSIRVDGVKQHLGYFSDPALACNAYRVAKSSEAERWANRALSGEFILDQRVIAALLIRRW